MKSLCVFCGSSMGDKPVYAESAVLLGTLLAQNDIALVYGGAKVGLMGTVADAVLNGGGRVIGVLPQFLMDRELAHTGLSDLHLVDSMHERKAKMAELSDGFIAIAGGAGTLEELFEVWTWGLLGLHGKPVGVLNTEGYYDPLIQMADKMRDEGFLRAPYRDMLLVENTPEALLTKFSAYEPPVRKWG